ncbi:MAG: efflux RND transporter periplasmic adaptor subunit [Tepidisphaeraceae bacterium]|jgi:RND family efflux transporter MFP subunit
MMLKVRKITGLLRGAAVGFVFVALVALLMLWLSGRFSAKISTASSMPEPLRAIPSGATIVEAHVLRLPVTESAVGTIQAVHETTVASHILARVVEINLRAGEAVRQGEVLIRLADTDLRARLQEAKAAADSATAQHDQAVIDEKRFASLIQSKAVSQNEYDKALTTLKTTEADLTQANETIAEAQAVLAYATIVSPMDGVVVDKKVDVGDTAVPGQPLVTIYDPHHMQLVASVRESLARRLLVGQELGVRLDVLDKMCSARVSEIVPDAQSASRTFQVKVTGPCPPGLYTGMFGRIFIPLKQQDVLVIPRAAVGHVGQLELVDVADGQSSQRRAVRAGQIIGSDCEVLSGLVAGEKVIIPAGATTQSAVPVVEAIQP